MVLSIGEKIPLDRIIFGTGFDLAGMLITALNEI